MIANTNAVAKIAAVVAGLALAGSSFVAFAPTARAQSVADLQAQINALLAQIAALQGGSTGGASVTFTRDLTIGSTGADVQALQSFLMSKGYSIPSGPTTYFGTQTQAALAAYQAANGIAPAAGYFGPITRAKVNASGGTTTGGGTTGGALRGGAGDLTITNRTSGIEKDVVEGSEEKVVSFEAEADDNSDIAVTSLRIKLTLTNGGSTRANRYIEEAIVYLDDEEVGTIDVDDFTRSSNVFTGTVSLDDAVVRRGDKGRFYVALVAKDSISTGDLSTTFAVAVDRVRFEDASGAVLSESPTDIEATGVKFKAASDDNKLTVQSDSSTPAASILKVDDSSTSDDFHLFSFKLKTGSKSRDVEVTGLTLNVATTSAYATTTPEVLFNDIWLEVDGEKFDDYVLGTSTSVVFTFDEGDFIIDGDDTVVVKVYASFNKQFGNYPTGTKVTLSIANGTIVAEDVDGNSVALGSGTATGKAQTLDIAAASVSSFTWSTSQGSNSSDGIITFRFTVEADDDDFFFATSSIGTITGTATTTFGDWVKVSGDATEGGGGFTVASGDTATFEISYDVDGPGSAAVTITSVAGQEVPSDKQYSGLKSF